MKNFFLILLCIAIASCIPLRIAPTFDKTGYKVKQAKKFERKLPNEMAFIFKDPKNADEFYNYINTKYELNHLDVDIEVPVKINGELYYLWFYETEKIDKTLNLLPIFIDSAVETDLYDDYVWRVGNWYIVITIFDKNDKNCLNPEHPSKKQVIEYLKTLKKEYLSTHNYEELLFAKKS